MTGSAKARAERKAAQIARINEISGLARTAWFALLGYLVFVGITLLGVEDADFFVPSRRTQLPLANVEIPTASFFWTAPILGAALYTYLHLFLIKLWDAHVPPTSDGDPTHHWLVNDFVLIRQRDPVARARPLAWLTILITRLLVWVAGPFVLAYAWWRSMPAHDEWLTLLIAACLGVSLFVGFTSWGRAESRLRPWRIPWWRGWHKWIATIAGAILLVFVSWLRTEGGLDYHLNRLVDLADATLGTALLEDCAVYAENGDPIPDRVHDDCLFENGDPKEPADVQRDRIAASPWVPKLEWFTLTHEHRFATIWLDERETWNPLARTDLVGVELVELPESWRTPETARAAFRKTWCEREGLSMEVCDHAPSPDRSEPVTRQSARTAWCATHDGVDVQACLSQFANLDTRFEAAWSEERGTTLSGLPRLALSGRDLRNVFAPDTSLADANLSGARLEGAYLGRARLEGANLFRARLEEADLFEARLEGAYLVNARLKGATLFRARLEEANLSGAELDGANLGEARLKGATLFGTRLEGANLGGARLEGANLGEARLEGAYLGEARLEGANLGGAWLVGANLSGARLEGAYLAQARLDGARLGLARLDGADVRLADFRGSNWAGAFTQASAAPFADLRGAQGLTQAQLDNLVGNAGTLLPEGNAPDTNASFYVWTCWEQPQLDQVATAAVGDDEGAVLRAQFSCGPGNPRRKTGTPLALDAPYPNGHPLADRP